MTLCVFVKKSIFIKGKLTRLHQQIGSAAGRLSGADEPEIAEMRIQILILAMRVKILPNKNTRDC